MTIERWKGDRVEKERASRNQAGEEITRIELWIAVIGLWTILIALTVCFLFNGRSVVDDKIIGPVKQRPSWAVLPSDLDPSQIEHGVDRGGIEPGRQLVVQALARAQGNQTRAGHLLGINRDQVRYRIEKFGLERAAGPRKRELGDDQPASVAASF